MSEYGFVIKRPDMGVKKEGEIFVNLHYLRGYCPRNKTYFKELRKKMKKAFPSIDTADIEIGLVTNSTYCEGFTIIRWGGRLLEQEVDHTLHIDNAWHELAKPDYFFV